MRKKTVDLTKIPYAKKKLWWTDARYIPRNSFTQYAELSVIAKPKFTNTFILLFPTHGTIVLIMPFLCIIVYYGWCLGFLYPDSVEILSFGLG